MWDYIIKKVFSKNIKPKETISEVHPKPEVEKTKNISRKENIFNKDYKKEEFSFTNARILKCPVCNTIMNKKIFPHTKVEIDECPNCKGIFLDKGELQEIIGFDIQDQNKPIIIYSPSGLQRK